MSKTSVMRLDPTRSASLRRAIGVEVSKWFRDVRLAVRRSVGEDDDYGLADPGDGSVDSVFNAELEGGRWVTTDEGNKLYIKDGEPVAGNPHVIAAMKGKNTKTFSPTKGFKPIKNPEGKEYILYHGSNKDFDEFETGITGGSFLTSSRETAHLYTESDSRYMNDDAPDDVVEKLTSSPDKTIYETRAYVKKTATDSQWREAQSKAMDEDEKGEKENYQYERRAIEILKEKGFDSVRTDDIGDSENESTETVIVFDPRNVKIVKKENVSKKRPTSNSGDGSVGAVFNAFCPTGEGGGIDNSCSSTGGSSRDLVGGTRTDASDADGNSLLQQNVIDDLGRSFSLNDVVKAEQGHVSKRWVDKEKGRKILNHLADEGILPPGLTPSRGLAFDSERAADDYVQQIVKAGGYRTRKKETDPIESFTSDPDVAVRFASRLSAQVIPGTEVNAHGVVLRVEGSRRGERGYNLDYGESEVILPRDQFYGLLGVEKESIGTGFTRTVVRLKRSVGVTTNAFCPTGPGGGIDNSCGRADTYTIRQAIDNYSQLSYSQINDVMRGGGKFKGTAKKDGLREASIISQAFSDPKIVKTSKKTEILHRGISNDKVFKSLVRLKEGDEFSDKAFVSTSRNWEIAKAAAEDLGDSQVIMRIFAPRGTKYVEARKDEREVLLQAGTTFKVLKTDHVPAGYGYRKPTLYLDVQIQKAKRLTTNAGRFRFSSREERVNQFVRWIGETYDAKFGARNAEGTLARYVVMMHDKGMNRSYDDANAKGPNRLIGGTKERQLMSAGGRAEFLRRAKVDPSLIDRVKVLASRTYLDVKGVTRQSADKLRRILVDGMAAGANPREVARKMEQSLEMSKADALRIARTEMIRAHAEGQLDAMERMGVNSVTAVVEFSATKKRNGQFDSKVCPACQDLDGEEYSLQQPNKRKLKSPRGVIPVHPNCRCAWKPARDDADQPQKKPTVRKPAPGKSKPKTKERVADDEPVDELKSLKVEMFGRVLTPTTEENYTPAPPRKKAVVKKNPAKKASPRKTAKGRKVVKKKVTPRRKLPVRNEASPPELRAFSAFVNNI